MRKYFFIVVVLVSFLQWNDLIGQENIPLGNWRVHLSYENTKSISLFPGGVVAGAKDGVFLYYIHDGEINTITTLDGIHSSEISAVGYKLADEKLFIGHLSGAIDIVTKNSVTTLDELLEDDRVNKEINHFHFYENQVYISTAIGLLIYNPTLQIFTATYDELGEAGEDIPVYESIIFNDQLFLATDKGVISAPSSGKNLNDFRNWNRYPVLADGKAESFATKEGELFVAIDNHDIYKYESGEWISTGFFMNEDFEDLSSSEGKLLVTLNSRIAVVENDQISFIGVAFLNSPVQALFGAGGVIYVADAANGLVKLENEQFEVIKPSGPKISDIHRMEVINDKLYALPGDLNFLNKTGEGFAVFSNGQWKNYSSESIDPAFEIPTFANAYGVAEFNDVLFISSVTDGLLQISGNEESVINADTPGAPFELFNNKTVLTGLAVTPQGLWVANYGADKPLHLFNGESWSSIELSSSFIADIITSHTGLLVLRLDPVFSEGVIIYNPDTGQQRFLDNTPGQGGLPSGIVNDVVFDREGKLWFATADGVAFISSLANIFTGEVDAVRPVLNNRFLLRNIEVTALAIDGGNRIWAGSEQGVWLFSAALDEEMYFFNEDNSPLLDDKLEDIILLQETGEVFFATSNGLVSFRSAATNPSLAESKVKIFPNPVMPGFNGTVGITGITADAIVKITDEAGNLIFQTQANGSTAAWELLNMNGQKIETGVYLVFTASRDGSDSLVGKIAVIQ